MTDYEQHKNSVIDRLKVSNISIIDLILIKKNYILVDTEEYIRTYSKEISYNSIVVTINILLHYAYTDLRDKTKVVQELSIEIEKDGVKINKVKIRKSDNDNTDTRKYLAAELHNYFEYLGI